jgi:hypothetical protein
MKACQRSQQEQRRRKCEGSEREAVVVVVWKIASGKKRRTRNMSEL